MNIATRARSLYGDARSLKSPRDLEYELLSQLTGRLSQAITGLDTALRATPELATALHENRQLWNVLASDLANSGNGLPTDLRVRLLSLARFIFAETDRIMSGSGGDPSALVDINRSIMRGLRDDGRSA